MSFEVDTSSLRASDSMKWGSVAPTEIAAWVADMDFGVPPAVAQAITERVERGELGYPAHLAGDVHPLIPAFEQRMQDRFGWSPAVERTLVVTDVIQAVSICLHHLTDPGSTIAMHVPAYNMFLGLFDQTGRRTVPIPLGDVAVDELIEQWRNAEVKLVVLVNPHNPTGHVFSRQQLEVIEAAAAELDLVVVSDEIHADLVFDGAHVPFASLSDDAARRTVTVTSASKAFNLAGLRCALMHVGPVTLLGELHRLPHDYLGGVSSLSTAAHLAAWTQSDDWHTQLLVELRDRRDRLAAWARQRGVGMGPQHATYLAWLDFSNTAIAADPAGIVLDRAGVRLSPGVDYTAPTDVEASGFARLNFATSAAVLDEILARIDRLI